ncbi:MAG: YadA-like family protein, partial [Candidatus Thioglobus sp.]|nr:YadA-like family protein [Candidatus Thioglobus sp.]
YAMRYNTTGSNNTAFGNQSMKANTTGGFNTAIGDDAQLANTTGSYNVSNGNGTLNSANGDSNTAIGYRAGYTNATGSNNVFIGHKAGYNETGSNKLYISNGDTASPLIQGDFSTQEVTINGNLTVNTLKDASGNNVLRKVGDVVHIGTNSFTIEDASTSSSSKDEIASSINELQIGTSTSHNTTVLGTLSVQAPTSNNHATTKIYVDTATNANTTSITTNSSDISAVQSKNTSQDGTIALNTTAISANTTLINTNASAINVNINAIQELETGVAQSMAMGALSTPSFGKSNFSIATGNYNGTHAIAYGFSHHDSKQDIVFRLLGSQSGNISSSAASVGWSF